MQFRYLLAIFCLLGVTVAAGEPITLTSKDGRSIQVSVLSMGESAVEVERSDGFEFTIEHDTLSPESIERLKQLRIESVAERMDELTIGFSSKRTDKTEETFDFHGLETTTHQTRISIRKPRRLNLDGLRLDYIIFIKRDKTGNSQGNAIGSHIIQESVGNSDLSYETSVYTLNRIFLLPGKWWDREKEEYEDVVEGSWIRLYANEALLYEASSPRDLLKEKSWQASVR